jgi:hypothetical protein
VGGAATITTPSGAPTISPPLDKKEKEKSNTSTHLQLPRHRQRAEAQLVAGEAQDGEDGGGQRDDGARVVLQQGGLRGCGGGGVRRVAGRWWRRGRGRGGSIGDRQSGPSTRPRLPRLACRRARARGQRAGSVRCPAPRAPAWRAPRRCLPPPGPCARMHPRHPGGGTPGPAGGDAKGGGGGAHVLGVHTGDSGAGGVRGRHRVRLARAAAARDAAPAAQAARLSHPASTCTPARLRACR